MKTLYELLEVSESASKEVIEKAYKVLAKKYHPDLQTEENKAEAEQKMKQINEAYDILSDDSKRENYNRQLQAKREQNKANNTTEYTQTQSNQTQNYQAQSNQAQSNNQGRYTRPQEQTNYANNSNYNKEVAEEELRKMQEQIKNMQNQYEKKYEQAYEGYLKSLGYRIKYKWTKKRFKELLKTILIITVIVLAIWFFPPTRKILVDFYESNSIVKTVIDIISKILVAIWDSICSIFKN